MEKWLLVGIAIALAMVIPISTFAVSNWHCCINPSCQECANDLLGCNCELKEKLGMQVCNECSAHGCGMDAADMEEMHQQQGGCDAR